MVDSRLYFITAALYLLLGLRVLLMQRASATAPAGKTPSEALVRVLVLAVLVVHGLLLHGALFVGGQLDLSLGHTLSLIAAATVAIYWIVSFQHRLGLLHPIILILAGLLVLSPLVLPDDKLVSYSGLMAFRVHLVVSLLAYALFALASLHAVLVIILEQRLHNRHITPLGQFPSLVAMDSLLFQMILAGFILLTAALASGIFFSQELFGKPLVFNHKVVFSIIAWLVYAGLLTARQRWGIRGKRASRWALTGFGLLLLGYVGSKFVLEVLLHHN